MGFTQFIDKVWWDISFTLCEAANGSRIFAWTCRWQWTYDSMKYFRNRPFELITRLCSKNPAWNNHSILGATFSLQSPCSEKYHCCRPSARPSLPLSRGGHSWSQPASEGSSRHGWEGRRRHLPVARQHVAKGWAATEMRLFFIVSYCWRRQLASYCHRKFNGLEI